MKKRDLDGNVTDKSDPDRKPKRDSFDESLLKYINNKSNAKVDCIETVVKDRLLKFVAVEQKTMVQLLEEANIRNSVYFRNICALKHLKLPFAANILEQSCCTAIVPFDRDPHSFNLSVPASYIFISFSIIQCNMASTLVCAVTKYD